MDDTRATDEPQAPRDPSDDTADRAGMSLLRAGVPLSLLIDLSKPDGPDSADLFLNETKPDSVWHRLNRPA